MSDPDVSLTRTYCTAIARRVQQGRVQSRFLAISGYTPTPIGTGRQHSLSVPRWAATGIWLGQTMAPRRPGRGIAERVGLAPSEASRTGLTQGNDVEIDAFDRNVPSVPAHGLVKRYCTLLHATIPVVVSLGLPIPSWGTSEEGGGMRPWGAGGVPPATWFPALMSGGGAVLPLMARQSDEHTRGRLRVRAARRPAGDVLFSSFFVAGEINKRLPVMKGRKRVCLVVRLDLDNARPPIWRRLRLGSDLRLSQVHDVVQAAMGWSDSTCTTSRTGCWCGLLTVNGCRHIRSVRQRPAAQPR